MTSSRWTSPSLPAWMAGILAFPIAGLTGRAAGGPVDDLGAALVGGAVTGLVLGAGQWLAARGRLPRAWIPATAGGFAAGLAAGAALVGYDTSLGALAAMGAVAGVAIAGAQAATLPRSRPAVHWVAAGPVLWALGWTVTTLAGIDVEERYTLFGLAGATALMLAAWPVVRRLEVRA